MELKDIQELMKVLKKEDIAELKVRYGKVKLTLTNSVKSKNWNFGEKRANSCQN